MQIGQHYIYPATALYDGKRLSGLAPDKVSILYRWWFPKDSCILRNIEAYTSEHPEDYRMQYVIKNLKTRTFDVDGHATTYYALYMGKSTNGHKRFGNHIRGTIDNSTLRRTIAALLDNKEEDAISTILMQCYYEWMEMTDDPELIDSLEMIAISVGSYPLNIDGNHSISDQWKNHLCNSR